MTQIGEITYIYIYIATTDKITYKNHINDIHILCSVKQIAYMEIYV